MEDRERLKKVITWSNLSTNAFSLKIGMKRSENLYHIIRNNENISSKLSMLINKTYPQISKKWLIYNEGEMIKEDPAGFEKYYTIPYYETLNNEVPSLSMHLPLFEKSRYSYNNE